MVGELPFENSIFHAETLYPPVIPTLGKHQTRVLPSFELITGAQALNPDFSTVKYVLSLCHQFPSRLVRITELG